MVSVPGYQAFTVDDTYIVKVKKWPGTGDMLPIEASQANPRELKILWDEVRRGRSTPRPGPAGGPGDEPAGARRRRAGVPPGRVRRASRPSMVDGGRQATPAEVQQYEAMTGMDLDGDGRIAGGAAAPGGAAGDGDRRRRAGQAQPPPPGGGRPQPGSAETASPPSSGWRR